MQERCLDGKTLASSVTMGFVRGDNRLLEILLRILRRRCVLAGNDKSLLNLGWGSICTPILVRSIPLIV
jgi:hypothetical protein